MTDIVVLSHLGPTLNVTVCLNALMLEDIWLLEVQFGKFCAHTSYIGNNYSSWTFQYGFVVS